MYFSIFRTVSKHSIVRHREYIFSGPKVLRFLPENFKNIDSLEKLKILIKKWKPENCPSRLCKVYIKNVGFVNNKKLCIISQDYLIAKFNIF